MLFQISHYWLLPLLLTLPNSQGYPQEEELTTEDYPVDNGNDFNSNDSSLNGTSGQKGRFFGLLFPQADTNLGRVRGTVGMSRGLKPFSKFTGIPYARPPVGNLRFEPPQPASSWSGTMDTKLHKPKCMQVSILTNMVEGSEDCLYLNIFTKKAYLRHQRNEDNLHPVIVFIHGGLFMFGESNIFDGGYFMDEDVVFVNLNYRLASLGFLNIGDSRIHGNMGMKDQVMALKWVQENIKAFNGDPTRVTLMGESAGSVAVHLHTLSKMSSGLFSGAISMSGTALSPWALIENPRAQAKEFAEGLGCPTDNPADMTSCLKSLPAKQIAQYHRGYIKALAEEKNSLFGPTIESRHEGQPFLPMSPVELMKAGQTSTVPWITGVNSAEGLVNLIPIIRNKKLREKVNSEWEKSAPTILYYKNHPQKDQLSADVKKHYLDNKPISPDNMKDATRMFSERQFFLDAHEVAILHSTQAPVYVYYNSYAGRYSMGNLLFSKANLPLPDDFNYMVGAGFSWLATWLGWTEKNDLGVGHGDEMPLFFFMPLIPGAHTSTGVDYLMSRKLIKLWVSFAATGVPDPGKAGESVKWTTVLDNNPNLDDIPLKYLNIDKRFRMIDEPFFDGIQFWVQHSISSLLYPH